MKHFRFLRLLGLVALSALAADAQQFRVENSLTRREIQSPHRLYALPEGSLVELAHSAGTPSWAYAIRIVNPDTKKAGSGIFFVSKKLFDANASAIKAKPTPLAVPLPLPDAMPPEPQHALSANVINQLPATPEPSPQLEATSAGENDPTRPCASQHGTLNTQKWAIYEVDRMQALYAGHGEPADPNPKNFAASGAMAMCGLQSADGECLPGGPRPDIVVSGTFSDHYRTALGPILRRGQMVEYGYDKVYGRGGVAVLRDGTTVVCRPGSTGEAISKETIDRVCSRNGVDTYDYIGGGALMINDGRKVCSGKSVAEPCDHSADLAIVQRFDQMGSGINSEQMRATQHTIIATRAGHAYVIWPKIARSGRQIQDELCAAGFTSAVKYDGGSGFYVRGAGVSKGTGLNPSGFLIKFKH